MQWKGEPKDAAISWHDVKEITPCFHKLQEYIIRFKNYQQQKRSTTSIPALAGLKRKNPHDEAQASLPTPSSRQTSAAPSAYSSSSGTNDFKIASDPGPTIYNAVFQRKEGSLIPKLSGGPDVAIADTRDMPTASMLSHSLDVDLLPVERVIRLRYLAKLQRITGPRVSFVNEVNHETPSLGFEYIDKNILTEGVEQHDELMTGCSKCKPNMGANRGCEYTKRCDCLEYAFPDESKMNEEELAQWEYCKANGLPAPENSPKRFPYINTGNRSGCLISYYLESRHVIYECNALCGCGPICKNRNVQHGRKVKLEIFKTNGRGFGAYHYRNHYTLGARLIQE